MLETEDGDDFDSDDNDALMDPIQGHWTGLLYLFQMAAKCSKPRMVMIFMAPIHVIWVSLGIPEMEKF